MEKKVFDIKPVEGKLGILTPGMGAVATTFIAGVIAIRKGIGKPIGSLTQMGTIRLGKRTDARVPMIKDFISLAGLNDIVFAGWDIFEDNAYEAAIKAGVLDKTLLDQIKPELEKVKPMRGVFDKEYVKLLDGTYIKNGANKMELAEQLREDIRNVKKQNNLSRMVIVWCGSTEVFITEDEVHASLAAFEKGLRENHTAIAPSMIYAYAALKEGVPYANGAPNLTVEIPALQELAMQMSLPVSGKDFKTGQTFMKTLLAPGFKARLLGLSGWFSTNILGNRDGEVLDDPMSFKSKEVSKLGVLEYILQPEVYPDLYKEIYHKSG